MPPSPPILKVCTCCEVPQPLIAFGTNRQAKDGKHYYCRTCAALKRKAWADANRKKAAASSAAWKQRMKEEHAHG